jgi:phenylalanyl-tRNA synthetase alpha chain
MISEESILQVRQEAIKALSHATNVEELENLRVEYVGRKHGKITQLFAELPKLSLANKRQLAPILNEAKDAFVSRLEDRNRELATRVSQARGAKQVSAIRLDITDPTVPGVKPQVGHEHPTIKVISEIKEIFHYLGFGWQDGPEVELDLYNFQKLRLHKDHPARDTQQTYYLFAKDTNFVDANPLHGDTQASDPHAFSWPGLPT